MPVGGVHKVNTEFFGVVDGLLQTVKRIFTLGFGFYDGKIGVFVGKQIINKVALASLTADEFSPVCKVVLSYDVRF